MPDEVIISIGFTSNYLSTGPSTRIQKSITFSHCSEKAWFIWEWEAVLFNCKVVYKNAMGDTAIGAEKIR